MQTLIQQTDVQTQDKVIKDPPLKLLPSVIVEIYSKSQNVIKVGTLLATKSWYLQNFLKHVNHRGKLTDLRGIKTGIAPAILTMGSQQSQKGTITMTWNKTK